MQFEIGLADGGWTNYKWNQVETKKLKFQLETKLLECSMETKKNKKLMSSIIQCNTYYNYCILD